VPEGVPLLLVGNKADLLAEAAGPGSPADPGSGPSPALPGDAAPASLPMSALHGEGRERLTAALLQLCGAAPLEGLQVALNARQRELAAAAATALVACQAAASEGLPWDFWTIDLREAVRRLGEITGEEVSEAVLDRVFSRFCIGK
jgi:tRNA modification GTPase